jgi:hypothetical protein
MKLRNLSKIVARWLDDSLTPLTPPLSFSIQEGTKSRALLNRKRRGAALREQSAADRMISRAVPGSAVQQSLFLRGARQRG